MISFTGLLVMRRLYTKTFGISGGEKEGKGQEMVTITPMEM